MINKDSAFGVFTVAFLLCLVASALVSVAAVSLKPQQQKNKELDKKKNILMAAGLFESQETIEEVYASKVVPRVIDLASGEYNDSIDPKTYDDIKAAKDPKQNIKIASGQDLAGIKTRARYATAYEVKGADGSLTSVVLPIYGKGLWSTMYGFISLDKNIDTIKGLGFYQHGETPGLGGEVDNPIWKASWKGKEVYDDQQALAIEVLKGKVDKSSAKAKYQVDGFSGATITAKGVSQLVRYWLGEDGFGKYLAKLKQS